MMLALYVGFCDVAAWRAPTWWMLRPGYRHCFVMQYLPEIGQWLVIDPSWQRLSLHMVSGERIDLLAALCWQTRGCVLKVRPGRLKLRPRLWWNGCTAITASLTGHRSALSPWRLAQRLRRAGASEVFHGRHDQDAEAKG